MARLKAEARLCFYPAPPDAITGICEHIACNSDRPNDVQILDPCCGDGKAIKQIADHLGLPYENVYCVELDEDRAQQARDLMPGAHVLGPASFLSTDISKKSFGLIYCNPPFGHELGGQRREEQAFAERCTSLLRHNGTLVMVLPINAIAGNGKFVSYFDSRYQEISVHRFPDHCRNYREIVVIAKQRIPALPEDRLFTDGHLHKMGWRYGGHQDPAQLPKLGDHQPIGWNNGYPSFDREQEVRVYILPWSWKPSKFTKGAYTDAEVLRLLADDELNKLLEEVTVLPPKEPPISISQAHLSMLLGSGELDGTVYYFDENGDEVVALRHVVRGVTSKKAYWNEEASTVRIDPEAEEVRIKNVWSQVINLDLHGFDTDGKLHSWCQGVHVEEEDGTADWERNRQRSHDAGQSSGGTSHGYPEDYDYELAAQLARMTIENGCTPHEAAQAMARIACMKEGKKYVAEDWVKWTEEFVARHTPESKAAA